MAQRMREWKFATTKTWTNWRAILVEQHIDPPSPKMNLVEIQGASAPLDLTDWDGSVYYSPREISCRLFLGDDVGDSTAQYARLKEIVAAVHGQTMRIRDADDTDNYFRGRCQVTDIERHQWGIYLTIKATCHPWRYDSNGNEVRT